MTIKTVRITVTSTVATEGLPDSCKAIAVKGITEIFEGSQFAVTVAGDTITAVLVEEIPEEDFNKAIAGLEKDGGA